MGIARDASVLVSAEAASTLSWTHTCTGSNLVLVLLGGFGNWVAGNTMQAVTYAGTPMTSVTLASVAGSDVIVYAWYQIAPSVGSNTLQMWSAVSNVNLFGGSISYTGANQSSQPDGFNATNTSSGTNESFTVTTTQANDWIAGMYVHENNPQTIAGSGGFTLLSQGTGAPSSGSWNSTALLDTNGAVASGANTVGATTNTAAATAALIAIAVQPAVAAGGSSIVHRFPLMGVGT